jgi:hypothetical protein
VTPRSDTVARMTTTPRRVGRHNSVMRPNTHTPGAEPPKSWPISVNATSAPWRRYRQRKAWEYSLYLDVGGIFATKRLWPLLGNFPVIGQGCRSAFDTILMAPSPARSAVHVSAAEVVLTRRCR